LQRAQNLRDLRAMWVCGVDEAGRGPLAGPVVAAAVVLPAVRPPRGLADSKTLSDELRVELAQLIRARCQVGVGLATVEEIDTLNIHQANRLAMRRAVEALTTVLGGAPAAALVDGRDRPPLPCAVEPIVAGDAHVPCISAASIIAKVERDCLMQAACAQFPGYGFGVHKGYGTPRHLAALRALGPCPLHRRSFKPVREALGLVPERAA